jgi:uncharacterized protein YjbI with pentapeptide repeats/MinD-like ATPase involved in chromosome partitioning or flagellar assembly
VTTTKTEVIAIASGKGGTGKTLIGACLGYALTLSGHRVLLVDTDTATSGLSLYLLGPHGKDSRTGRENSTWSAALTAASEDNSPQWNPLTIRRDLEGEVDHGIKYEALIVTDAVYIYGMKVPPEPTLPFVDRLAFQRGASALISALRAANTFDYILLDTRGGFSFESTHVCALCDSFIVVTDADLTSFVQDRNLVQRINTAAGELETTPLLRAIIVNRVTEGDERLFRLALEREFPITYSQTYAIPLDLDALKAYKTQQSPYVAAPGSHFSYATLTAFKDIMSIVTAEWSDDKVALWNQLTEKVSSAVKERNARFEREEEERKRQMAEIESIERQNADQKKHIEAVERELARSEATHQRELERAQREIERAQREVERADAFARQPRRSYRKLALPLGVVIAAIALAIAGAFYFRNVGGDSDEALLVKVYQSNNPPALRTTYLRALYHKGLRSFDKIDLQGIDLRKLDAPKISLRDANLKATGLANGDLSGADLSSADATGADFSGTLMTGANLTNCVLVGADLSHADLRGANLTGIRFDNTKWTGVRLSPGVFDGLFTREPTELLSREAPSVREGWVYLGFYDATMSAWKTRYLDFAANAAPESLVGKQWFVESGKGFLNVVPYPPTEQGSAPAVVGIWPDGTPLMILSEESWLESYQWARVSSRRGSLSLPERGGRSSN